MWPISWWTVTKSSWLTAVHILMLNRCKLSIKQMRLNFKIKNFYRQSSLWSGLGPMKNSSALAWHTTSRPSVGFSIMLFSQKVDVILSKPNPMKNSSDLSNIVLALYPCRIYINGRCVSTFLIWSMSVVRCSIIPISTIPPVDVPSGSVVKAWPMKSKKVWFKSSWHQSLLSRTNSCSRVSRDMTQQNDDF